MVVKAHGRPMGGTDEIMYVEFPAQDPTLNKRSINFSGDVGEECL